MNAQFNPQTIIIPIGVNQAEAHQKLFAEMEELRKEFAELKKEKRNNKKNKKQIEIEDLEYSPLKSNGKQKARAAESIKSYDEFLAIQNYFLDRGNIRDWAFWTFGVSIGARVSDLTALKINNVLNADLTFRKKICIREKKTSKPNEYLVTESVKNALTKYFDSIGWKITLNDYVFKSQKRGKLTTPSGWRIISTAAKALDIDRVIGSHTMRKTFGNIVACVSKSTIDMNLMAKLQSHYNHSDQRITMGYVGAFADAKDEDRIAVSDFVLGRSEINELKLGAAISTQDIAQKLEELKKILEDK